VINKKAEVVRVYLIQDANTLLSVGDHVLRSRHYVNVIVAGKQPAHDRLSMDEASRTARAASASGTGPAPTRAPNPIWCWPAPGCAHSRTLAATAILRRRPAT